MGDNGIDRLQNDEAARRLLQPDDGRPGGHGILPPLDPVTGVVEGTGMGAGGGNQGEDHDDDHTAGSNTVR
jgi:hypothetical protein